MSEIQEQLQKEQEGSIQERETKVLEKAGVKIDDNTYKLDLKNAVQKQSPDESVLREEEPKVELQEVVGKDNEQLEEGKEEAIELINEEEDELYSKKSKENEEQPVQNETRQQETQAEVREINLPENIQSLVKFMNETGGSLEDYIRLSADYSKVDDLALLREYYKQTKPHLDRDEIDFLIEDQFAFDEDLDSDKDIKRKKLAYKQELNGAREFLSGLKDRYYQEVKSRPSLSQEAKNAIDFFNKYKEQQDELTAIQKQQSERFTKMTNEVFHDEFKGFDFKVGDNRYRFKVNDVQQAKNSQLDLVKAFGTFLNEDNSIKDAYGYHKAVFVARNADSIVNHFYEQGKADAIRQLEAESKNINMNPRKTSDGMIDAGGFKVRAISGDDSSQFKVKIRK